MFIPKTVYYCTDSILDYRTKTNIFTKGQLYQCLEDNTLETDYGGSIDISLLENVHDRFVPRYEPYDIDHAFKQMIDSMLGVPQKEHFSKSEDISVTDINSSFDHSEETKDTEVMNDTEGIKEKDGKLFYELDWQFVQDMAERIAQNKGKYPPYNWKKNIPSEDIRQALIRHFVEIAKGNYEDDGRPNGHLEAIAINAMFLAYINKNKSN